MAGTETRDRFIAVAKRQFAEKGFYGASIAAIAMDMGLTKQALLHHFGSKSKLYAEVLRGISDPLVEIAQSVDDVDPITRLCDALLAFQAALADDPNAARILMREILDNQGRAETARKWFLKPMLDGMADHLTAIPGNETLTRAQAMARLYLLIGAVVYFPISGPTLTAMFGAELLSDMVMVQTEELSRLIANGA